MDEVQTVMFGATSSSMDYLRQLLYLEWIIIFLLGVPG